MKRCHAACNAAPKPKRERRGYFQQYRANKKEEREAEKQKLHEMEQQLWAMQTENAALRQDLGNVTAQLKQAQFEIKKLKAQMSVIEKELSLEKDYAKNFIALTLQAWVIKENACQLINMQPSA